MQANRDAIRPSHKPPVGIDDGNGNMGREHSSQVLVAVTVLSWEEICGGCVRIYLHAWPLKRRIFRVLLG
jgi:hypothetical protein